MSWITNINQDMVIRTGDGKEYRPYWFDANYNKQFNIAEFDFRRVQGTLVIRGTQKGRVFDINIVFQGDDCLTVSDAFSKSSDNSKTWSLYHPMYGTFNVHPSVLRFDNTGFNQTRITGIILETTSKAAVAVTVAPEEKVIADGKVVIDTSNEAYSDDVPEMSISDLNRLRGHIDSIYNTVSLKIANVQSNVDEYRNAYNAANAVLNIAIYSTNDIIEQAAFLFQTPYIFQNTIRERIDMFALQMALLSADIEYILSLGVDGSGRNLKKLYENNAAVSMVGMCNTTVTNVSQTDYRYTPQILQLISDIIGNYNSYIDNLCTLQTANGGELDSYIPNADTVRYLSSVVYYATSTLYEIATQSLQSRVYYVPYDTNLINVAHLLYGLDVNDTTLQTLIETNDIQLNEYLIIKQGTELVYYV
jgi:hypothetical protein